jgi:hypothetical protein
MTAPESSHGRDDEPLTDPDLNLSILAPVA